MIRSGWTLVRARYIWPNADQPRFRLSDIGPLLLYTALIIIPGFLLDLYQRLHQVITKQPRAHPESSWQFYLYSGLREDLAHHTNETTGYHQHRPPQATELDDLTAWVMTVIQFLWSYETLMGVVWDEWTLLRLVQEAAAEVGVEHDALFARLQRQWELERPYTAPLNGTYADMRRVAFDRFIQPRLDRLPVSLQGRVVASYTELRQTARTQFQAQMSLLARILPGRFMDHREPLPIWDAYIAIIYGGCYYLIDVAIHDEQGNPVMYGPGGIQQPLRAINGELYTASGDRLKLVGEQLRKADTGEWVGYLDMAPAASVKHKLQMILEQPPQDDWEVEPAVDILLAETPRRCQRRLRGLLPVHTRRRVEALSRAPIILNWDEQPRDRTLAELRRARRGIGDHSLTIMRTDSSILFDQSHIFFDGTWSLAMAEVLTSAAVQWCRRCIAIAPAQTSTPRPLDLEPTQHFLREARRRRQVPEVSAETVIYDISQIFKLRAMLLKEYDTALTVNDLLVTTRIFHAAHYRPSAQVQAEIDAFTAGAGTEAERRAARAVARSLLRGRRQNPALLIPVDASPVEPRERIFPLTFRNPLPGLVWAWDESWEAYQAFRRHDPPTTPEGFAAYDEFVRKRSRLVETLKEFSFILDDSKEVALRGESVNIAILKLLPHLPPLIQQAVKGIAELSPMVNEIARGDEVYSNVGRVASGSSLSRFMSAKDDGNTKVLVWGIMTDDQGRMIVTMRDFRPHVQPLIEAGRIDLAQRMAQDYANSYTADLIGLVARLWAMLQATDPRTLRTG